ncbi:MAG: dihydroneopterin aldolase [Gammaproteobacteria bacterium]|nr:dihydroneopterin aldolase [Gammaproteobacteria bacterium]
MTDRLEINNLAVPTRIGVHSWERRVRQTLLIDVELPVDIRPAAGGDDLTLALDYTAVAARVRAFGADSERLLIETFAEDLAADLLGAFGLAWVKLSVQKPGAIGDAAPVRLSIERRA